MKSYKLQIDVDPETGITVHFKQPDAAVEVTRVTVEIELSQLLLSIGRVISDAAS